jgi:hypothetical protein
LKEERKRERNNKLMPILPVTDKGFDDDDFIRVIIVNNNLEEGIECFNHWLSTQDEGYNNSNDEDSKINIQLILKVFEKEKNKLLLYDNILKLDIEVIFIDGVPFCTLCGIDDCAHTGFTICAKQNLDG